MRPEKLRRRGQRNRRGGRRHPRMHSFLVPACSPRSNGAQQGILHSFCGLLDSFLFLGHLVKLTAEICDTWSLPHTSMMLPRFRTGRSHIPPNSFALRSVLPHPFTPAVRIRIFSSSTSCPPNPKPSIHARPKSTPLTSPHLSPPALSFPRLRSFPSPC